MDARFIGLSMLRNRQLTAIDVKNRLMDVRNVNVSHWAVRRRFAESSLWTLRPTIDRELLKEHPVARLQFARAHLNWLEAH